MTGAIDLRCNENKVDENGMKKLEKEEQKVKEEIELFNFLKNYADILNKEETCTQFKLNVVATGLACEVKHFCFVVYAARRWPNFLVNGLAKYVEEKYDEIVHTWTIPCEYIVTEVVPDHLYVYRFLIDSKYELYTSMLNYPSIPKPVLIN